MSADLSTVVDSVNANGICIKGVIAVPEVGHDGDLQNVAQSFRNKLDLYANVVKVSFKVNFFSKYWFKMA